MLLFDSGKSTFQPIMNFHNVAERVFDSLKRVAIPVSLAGIVFLLPSVRNWWLPQFQVHPLRGALVLAVLCLVILFLTLGRRGVTTATSAEFRDAGVILFSVLTVLGIGWLFAGASTTLATEEIRPASLNCALLWATACFLAGFLGGFLFGVPKVDGADAAAKAAVGAGSTNIGSFVQRPNTNLEQISDWLTKIIVGLGLVELRTLPAHLRHAATWVAQTFSSSTPPSQAIISFAGALIIYFGILGFLAGYLLTMLFLAGAFGRAGQQAYGKAGSFFEDPLSTRIRNFWRPNGGPPIPGNTQKLTDWIGKNLAPGTLITDLISTKELEQARHKVVADLVIP
jgi:hypothetical protein